MGRPAPLRFEVLAQLPERVRETWRHWAQRDRISPFGSPAFFEAWCAAFAGERTGFVIAGRRDGELAFLLPLWCANERPDHWSSLGAFRADYTEAVTSQADPAFGDAFWSWFEREAPCCTGKIARFPEDSILGRTVPPATLTRRGRAFHALSTFARGGGVRYLSTGTQHEHPYADRASIEELALRIDGQNVRRKIRMLASQAGEVAYAVVRDPEAIAALLPTFFAMHVANFAGTGRASQFESARERTLYETLAASPELRSVIYIDLLTAGDRPVAMHVGFQQHARIYWYKPAFDVALSKASPGRSLLAHVFARAKAEGIERVDLLKGTEPYKSEWATHWRTTVTSTLVRRRASELVRSVTNRWLEH